MIGDRFAICNNGKWSKDPPICIKASGCPPLTPQPGMIINKLHDGAMATFSCSPGRTRHGNEQIWCNGKSWSGEIPQCVAGTTTSCDFEQDNCGWSHDTSADFQWLRHKGSTPTAKTGPQADHTTGTAEGHYVFVESSSPVKV